MGGKYKSAANKTDMRLPKEKREALSGQETSPLTTEDVNSRQQQQNSERRSFLILLVKETFKKQITQCKELKQVIQVQLD